MQLGGGGAGEDGSGREQPVHSGRRLGQRAELAGEALLSPRADAERERNPARVQRGGALRHEAVYVCADGDELDAAARRRFGEVGRGAEAHGVAGGRRRSASASIG